MMASFEEGSAGEKDGTRRRATSGRIVCLYLKSDAHIPGNRAFLESYHKR
jgi:hypothetical protein